MPRVLVAERDPSARRFLRCALELGDHQVIEADRGDDAIRAIRAGGVDVVVTDHRLPRADGVEVIRAAQSMDPDLPCLALAGYTDQEATDRALEAGAVGVIPTPATVRQVMLCVDRACERRRLAQEVARTRRVMRLLGAWLSSAEGPLPVGRMLSLTGTVTDERRPVGRR